MKKTRFTEPTEMETVLINHPNDEICYNEGIRTGAQWLEYLRACDSYVLGYYVQLVPTSADYYDFDMEEL